MLCGAGERTENGVTQPMTDDLHNVWRQLSKRNDWKLVTDEANFLAQAAAELLELTDTVPTEAQIRLALTRAYGVRLYQGLQQRHDLAAQELWFACFRMALREGWQEADAEVLAQETVTRVIEKLGTLRSPQSIISWMLRIFRTVRTSYNERQRSEEPLLFDEDDTSEPAAPMDVADDIEQQVLGEAILTLLDQQQLNPLERMVLVRIVMIGDVPRDVAHDLDLPLHRTRLAKSRALQRLRNSTHFMQQLELLSGETPPPTVLA